MATNTLTGLIPTFYEAIDTVAREHTGFAQSVTLDASSEMVALNQTVRSPLAPVSSAVDITPAAYSPASGDQVISYLDMSITKNKSVPIQWTGDEQMSVKGLLNNILRDQFAQAIRTLTNLIEADLVTIALNNASRAVGTAGTTPFATASDLSDLANVAQILDDNGAPRAERIGVLSSATWAKLRGKQSQLFKVNEAGSSALLRSGIVEPIFGFQLLDTGASMSHTAGTGASYQTNHATYANGAVTIAADTGTGTILAGDVVTLSSGDANRYVVNAALAAGSFGISAPGLRVGAAWADNTAFSLAASYTGNVMFHKSALRLLARQPAMPAGGDGASDVVVVVDPVSGIPFQIAMYKQYRQVHLEVGIAWGVACSKPEFVATLLG